MAQVAFQDKPKPPEGQPEQLAHYKSNMNSIVGDGTVVPWPDYTQYLDIEPELAVVYGNAEQPVAGYCIFNDVSARDVQATELVGGFCLSKDVANGNQIGPYLVTTDEAGDVFDQTVKVEVNGALRFEGSTSEISHKADAVFAWLGYITPLRSGSVMGFGTVPDCTGLDQGDFLKPGDDIVITFDRLGSLRSKLGKPAEKLLPSRWTARPELGGFRKD